MHSDELEGNMRILAIVQARMGSRRFPGKIMADINGMPLFRIVYKRLKMSRFIDQIIFATTNNREDDKFVLELVRNKILFSRGSESDVLKRYYDTAKKFSANIIVRVTCDDPLKCSSIIDYAISRLKENKLDYCSNTMDPSFPEGLDVECFTFEALGKAERYARNPYQREHVTPYIYENLSDFKVDNFSADTDYSKFRLTIDYFQDLSNIRAFYRDLNNNYLAEYRDILELLKKEKYRELLVDKIPRNQGLLRSMEKEKWNE